MNIAITLVHNKTDAENSAQVTALASLLTEVIDGPFTNEETGETWTTIHHELKDLDIPHEVRVYQIVPYGVTPPANMYSINSGGTVLYGRGDEDKTGEHPRFFNWGLKRGTDNGADLSIYLQDVSKLDPKKIAKQLEKLMDKADPTELVEDAAGTLATLRVLKEVGQLEENQSLDQAMSRFKSRITERGLKHG